MLDNGRLLIGDPSLDLATRPADPTAPIPELLDRRIVDELMIVARWLDRETTAGRARLLDVSGAPASPSAGGLPAYEAVSRRGIRRGR